MTRVSPAPAVGLHEQFLAVVVLPADHLEPAMGVVASGMIREDHAHGVCDCPADPREPSMDVAAYGQIQENRILRLKMSGSLFRIRNQDGFLAGLRVCSDFQKLSFE